jgi:hypothetical protein
MEVMWPYMQKTVDGLVTGENVIRNPKVFQGRFLTQHAPLIIARKYIKTFPNSPHNNASIF